MTVYKQDLLLYQSQPLLYPLVPDAYELRLIDDDEPNSYKPFFQIGALDRRERIGEYECLAFVQAKSYKPRDTDPGIDKALMEELKKQNVSTDETS